MFFLYEALLYLVFFIALPWFAVIGFLRGKYLSNLPERLGIYRDKQSAHDLWFHAVSVGEVLAARTVAKRVFELRPETTFIITTTTITGQQLARQIFPKAAVTYYPFDFSFSVKRFLDHFNPRVYATMETEIWPNVARYSARRGVAMIVANGRISDRSFPRYRVLRWFLEPILHLYSVILVREPIDRTRMIEIGAPAERVEVVGNVKFDLEDDSSALEIDDRLRALIAGRPVFVAGSTIEGEDELLIPLLEKLVAGGTFVVLAPRKPERFEIVADLLSASGFRLIRRTEVEVSRDAADVLLLDSIGELSKLYRYATASFVGGSLIASGGHNPIEPAAAGSPVAFGPHMSNFREIAAAFLENEAAVQVAGVDELEQFVGRMIHDRKERDGYAARAFATVEANRGAAQRTAARIIGLLA